MRCQHCFGALFFFRARAIACGFVHHFFAFRSDHTVGMDFKNLIESQSGKKLVATLAAMHYSKVTLSKLLQPQSHRGHCSHEGGIHHRTMLEVKNELAVTPVDHLSCELL